MRECPSWMSPADALVVERLQAELDEHGWPDAIKEQAQQVLDVVYALDVGRRAALGEHLRRIAMLTREGAEAMALHRQWPDRIDVLEAFWARASMGWEIASVIDNATFERAPFIFAVRLADDRIAPHVALDPRLRVDPILVRGLSDLLYCSPARPVHPGLYALDATRLLRVAATHEQIDAFANAPDALVVPGDWEDEPRLASMCALAHDAIETAPACPRSTSLSTLLFASR